ncbi:hypothetical protein AJ80_05996 [Polytolypa hystricis UAMH7299]|uniref:Zn(2)-C6 fungal-type domain-containing protein n=1 Tax=Polytolypa hystricis (strain UAMH7299) TaxID=1447883 RepID=A0A2B7XYH3_POLH7|nr:hypothetical protein AJ80_05996 [Polytolypa hystricis UAMH7299]
MADRVSPKYPSPQQSSGEPLQQDSHRTTMSEGDSVNLASRDHNEMAPAPSYPSPNAAQINQGTMSYYANQSRQLTADELHLSAELSREASAANMNNGSANGIAHGQPMVLGPSNPGAPDMNRTPTGHHHAQQQQQQHILQFPPNQQVGVDPNHDLSYGDQSARKKRTKVSRACDECRRKKVRCDATSEAGVETCTNCRRTNATCEFSRVPMKRGPSKGYIKELADRINSLESQIQPGIGQEMQYQPMQEDASPRYHEFSPSVEGNLLTRKRTYSMSEGLPNAFMQPPFQTARPSSVGGWPVQTPTKDTTQAPQAEPVDMYSSALLANGSAKVNQPFWSQDESAGQQAALNTGLGDELQAVVDIDEKILDAYYQHIHPILPVFPNSKDRFHDHLQQCNRQVQEAFLHCLVAIIGADPIRAEKEFQQIPTFEKAQEGLYASFREDPSSRSLSTNFVLLQSIILMILEADSRGPENMRGQNGVPKSVLLEGAFSLAYHVAKSLGQLKTSNPEDQDIDSDANLARRNWVVVGVLSRWHAVAVAGPDFFGLNETATAEDRHTFGPATLQLSRYSTILSEIYELLFDTTAHTVSNYGSSRALKRNMHGQLNRIKDVEYLNLDGIGDPVSVAQIESFSPLMFWFITLLLKRHLYTYTPSEILYPAEVIINILHKQSESETPSPRSPFHMHFLALAIITLLEITDIPELASEAWEALDKALQTLSQREKNATLATEFEKIFTTRSWDAAFHAAIEAKLTKFRSAPEQQGAQTGVGVSGSTSGGNAPPVVGPTEQRSLQHLADLAVGAGGGALASSPPTTSAGNPPVAEDKDAASAAAGASGATTGAATAVGISDGLAAWGTTEPKTQQPRLFVDFTRLTSKGYLNVFAGNAIG